MKITVTKRDVTLGLKSGITSNTHCPVARAFTRAGFKKVNIGVDYIRSGDSDMVKLPLEAVNAITGMCCNRGMKPFSFVLTKQQVSILRG